MLYQTKWEILPLNIQNTIKVLIHRKQNEEGLSLGPLGVGINREIFKVVCICNIYVFLYNNSIILHIFFFSRLLTSTNSLCS